MFDKFFESRRAMKELRSKDAELRAEYMRMYENDLRTKAQSLPTYDQVKTGSGESVTGMGTDGVRLQSSSISSSTGSTMSGRRGTLEIR